MKIVWPHAPTNKPTFGSLSKGDIFKYPAGHALYMKAYGEKSGYRAVHLESGGCYYIPDIKEVVLVKCELVVHDEDC